MTWEFLNHRNCIGRPTDILEQARLRRELEAAARRVQEARAERDQLVDQEDRERRAKAHSQLAIAEVDFLKLIARPRNW
ncbi:MAG: hypothetical protein WB239_08455 [Acidimicrobiia bacterium]